MWKLLLTAGTFLSKAADSLALSLSTVQSEEADGRLEVGVRRVRPFSAFRESKLSSSSQDMLGPGPGLCNMWDQELLHLRAVHDLHMARRPSSQTWRALPGPARKPQAGHGRV